MSELTFNEEKFQEMMDRLCDAVPDNVSSIEELSLYYDIFKKGYKYAVEKYERLIKKLLEQDISLGYANSFIDDLRKQWRNDYDKRRTKSKSST